MFLSTYCSVTTYLPPTCYLPTACLLPTFYLLPIYYLPTTYMLPTYYLHATYLPTTYMLPTYLLDCSVNIFKASTLAAAFRNVEAEMQKSTKVTLSNLSKMFSPGNPKVDHFILKQKNIWQHKMGQLLMATLHLNLQIWQWWWRNNGNSLACQSYYKSSNRAGAILYIGR